MKTLMKHAIFLVAAIAVLVMSFGVAASAQTANETTNESLTPRNDAATTTTAVACYATQLEYDTTPMAVGEMRTVRFYHPETGTATDAYIGEVSDNLTVAYEQGKDTFTVTATAPGDAKVYVLADGCEFGAYVYLDVFAHTTPRTTLNMTEVLGAYQAVAGNKAITAYDTALVDADFDGDLTMIDVLMVYQTVAGGNTEILPSVAYVARSIAATGFDAADNDNSPQLIRTAAEWRSFRAAFDEVPSSGYYPIGDLDFDKQAMIAVPEMAEDLYVADVATDDDTLYVSLVSLAVPPTDPAERSAWLFIQIDHTAFEGKSGFEVVVYRENHTTYEGVLNVTSKIVDYVLDYPFLPDVPCGCEDHAIVTFRSREECEAFVEAHQYPEAPMPLATITMDDFAAYDDAFFEEYMLVRTIYSAPSTGYKILPFAYFNASEDRLIFHRHVIVPDDDDYVLLAYKEHAAYIPVPKSYDHHQPIELADYVQVNYSYELL